MPKALVNGIHLHYQQAGEGPDVVMVHGITGNLAIWHLEIVPALMGEFRLTTFDLRGHGYSDMPPTGYATADLAEDMAHLLDVLGLERVHVVGHSFGADVALHFAILHPERVERLVLVEAAIAALKPMRDRHDWVGWEYWRSKLRSAGVTVPEDKWYDSEHLVRASINTPKVFGFRKGQPRRKAPLVRLMDTTTAAADYGAVAGMTLEKIEAVPHETLVVYGADSVFLGTYEYLRDHLENARSVLLPESEHFGPLEQPQRFLGYLREFLHPEEVARAG